MGVVRIDDSLLKRIKQALKEEDNKYKYGSVSSFLNYLIYQELKEVNPPKSIKKNG